MKENSVVELKMKGPIIDDAITDIQGLLELGLVAIPELRVGFEGGQLVEHLLDAFLGVEVLVVRDLVQKECEML